MPLKSDLTAKARRAAEWFRKSTGFDGDWDEFLGDMYFNIPEMSINEVEMIAYCEARGWQDQKPELIIPTEEEALDLCARGMAQTMDEVDPDPVQLDDGSRYGNSHIGADGVEWHVGSEWATVNGHTIAIECGQALFTWVVFQDGEQGVTARSNPVTPPHTREEARRQAVEAARGMG